MEGGRRHDEIKRVSRQFDRLEPAHDDVQVLSSGAGGQLCGKSGTRFDGRDPRTESQQRQGRLPCASADLQYTRLGTQATTVNERRVDNVGVARTTGEVLLGSRIEQQTATTPPRLALDHYASMSHPDPHPPAPSALAACRRYGTVGR